MPRKSDSSFEASKNFSVAATTKSLRRIDLLVVAGLVIVSGAFAIGFFYPDDLITGKDSYGIHHKLAIALQVIGVMLVPLIVGGYLLIRTGKLAWNRVLVAMLGVVAPLFVLYPFLAEIYVTYRNTNLRDNFHPYLQIAPPPFSLQETSSNTQPIRIVCLGGSTTGRTNTKGRQWTQMVEDKLRTLCPECNVEVYNQGVDWYTTLHSIINYTTNIRQYHPDIVVVMHGINDLMHNVDFGHLSSGAFRNDYGHYLGPLGDVIVSHGILGGLYGHFRMHWFAPSRQEIVVDKFPGAAPFRRNLETLFDMSQLDGAKFVILTEAYLYHPDLTPEEQRKLLMLKFEAHNATLGWNLKTAINGMREYDDLIRAVAKNRKANLVDLDAMIPRSLRYFLDDVHFTDESFDIVSENVSGTLLPLVRSIHKSGVNVTSLNVNH